MKLTEKQAFFYKEHLNELTEYFSKKWKLYENEMLNRFQFYFKSNDLHDVTKNNIMIVRNRYFRLGYEVKYVNGADQENFDYILIDFDKNICYCSEWGSILPSNYDKLMDKYFEAKFINESDINFHIKTTNDYE